MKNKFLFITFSFPLYLYASSINFDASLKKTLQNNKSLKAKRLNIEKSKLQLKQANSYNYGKLIFNENISRTNNAGYVFGAKLSSREASFGDFGFDDFIQNMNSIGVDGGKSLLETQPNKLNFPEARTNFETKISYSVPLFTGYKLSNAKKMAELQIMAQNAKYNYDENELSLEVLKAYNGAVASKEFIKATKKAKEATSSFTNFANELYKEGLVTSIDVKQAKVYDMGVDSKMVEAKNRYDLAISYLRFLTSDPTITDVQEFKNININSSHLKTMQNSAQENREDFKWMRYNTQTLKAKIDFDKSEKYPTIGAFVEYGYNDDKFSVSDLSDHDYYLGAITLSYTLFDASLTKTKEQISKIEYNKIQNYFEYMKDGIQLEVEKNLLTLEAKKEILNQKIKAQNLADQVLEQSSAMYKNHLINMSNLLMQQANQQKAAAQTIMAKYEKSLASAKLIISLGQRLDKKDK